MENHHELMKDIEEDTDKWKDSLIHGWKELILLKCPYFLSQLQIQSNHYKIVMTFFTDLEETTL
jgi:hypothetical protein